MTRVLAPQVRNSLASIYNQLPAAGLTTENVISRLQKDYAKELSADRDDILHIGLVRLADQIAPASTGDGRRYVCHAFLGRRLRCP